MSSKTKEKAPSAKRADAPLRCDYTRAFEKDWSSIRRAGRQNLHRAKDGMLLVIANDGMPPEFKDHALAGDLAGYREFHAGGDLLIIYHLDESGGTVVFTRIGTHAELFE